MVRVGGAEGIGRLGAIGCASQEFDVLITGTEQGGPRGTVGPWHQQALMIPCIKLVGEAEVDAGCSQEIRLAASLALESDGRSIPARMAMMAITTRSSIKVNAGRGLRGCGSAGSWLRLTEARALASKNPPAMVRLPLRCLPFQAQRRRCRRSSVGNSDSNREPCKKRLGLRSAPGIAVRVNVELELKPQARRGLRKSEDLEKQDQGFGGGIAVVRMLVSEVISAGRSRGQSDQASPRFHVATHPRGFASFRRATRPGEPGLTDWGRKVAGGMRDPRRPVRADNPVASRGDPG